MKKVILISLLISSFALNFSFGQVNDWDTAKVPQMNPNYVFSTPFTFPTPSISPSNGNGSMINARGTSVVTDLMDVPVFFDVFGYPQSEPHLTINRNHPNNIIISANCFDLDFSPNGQWTSFGWDHYTQSVYVNSNYNSPGTWNSLKDFPNYGDLVQGDPTTASSSNGELAVGTLDILGIDIIMNKSSDLGVTWGNAYYAQPMFSLVDADKEMISIDNLSGSPFEGRYYMVFTDGQSGIGLIGFSYSTNGGQTFTPPININNQISHGANVKTGPNGELYVCWADYSNTLNGEASGVGFAYSLNGGVSFVTVSVPIAINGIAVDNQPNSNFNDTRVNDFPVLAVDRSCGPFRGRIYVTYNELVNSKSRVKVKYSDNNGISWTSCNINGIVDIDGDQNWMPWIAVDDANGNVCVAYLSSSGSIFNTNTFLAYSDNGGGNFDNIKVSDNYFEPIDMNNLVPAHACCPFMPGYFGDYIAVDAYGGSAYVAWNDAHSGSMAVYCSTVQFSTPSFVSSSLDLPLNEPIDFSNTLNEITYEAYSSIIVTSNQIPFVVGNGNQATFKAGNSIHITPGFGSEFGSVSHLYIAPVPVCTSPFRKYDFSNNDNRQPDDPESNLLLYPNPVRSTAEIKFTVLSDSKINFILFDSYGKKIITFLDKKYTLAGQYSMQLNVQELLPGIYYLIYSYDKIYLAKKFIKMK